MKKVDWIVEKYIWEEYEEKIIQAIKDSGMKVHIFDEMIHSMDNTDSFIKKIDNDCVITHGSLQLGRQMLRQRVYPGIYLSLDKYECYNYYGYFGEYLLNSKYLMFGLNDLLRNRGDIKELFDNPSEIFIRPSNGYKTFAGQLLKMNDLRLEVDILRKSYGGVPDDTLVVVSPKQDVRKEYRFIVIDGKVISGSLYMDEDNAGTFEPYFDKLCTDQGAIDFAEKMVTIYQPESAYTIDVCQTGTGEYKLLELNSLCCASLYGNDLDKFVAAMNELCIKDYMDVYE